MRGRFNDGLGRDLETQMLSRLLGAIRSHLFVLNPEESEADETPMKPIGHDSYATI